MTEQARTDEEIYPAVELAYGFVIPSHEWVTKRLDAVDARLQSIQTFAGTVSFAAPVLATTVSGKPDYTSVPFITAMALFALIAILGTVIRAVGRVRTISPTLLYRDTLHYSPWEFKKNLIHSAGENFDSNVQLVKRKSCAANAMVIGFLLEVGCLLFWVARA